MIWFILEFMLRHMGNLKSQPKLSLSSSDNCASFGAVSSAAGDITRSLSKHKIVDGSSFQSLKSQRITFDTSRKEFSSSVSEHGFFQPIIPFCLVPSFFTNFEQGATALGNNQNLTNGTANNGKPLANTTSDRMESSYPPLPVTGAKVNLQIPSGDTLPPSREDPHCFAGTSCSSIAMQSRFSNSEHHAPSSGDVRGYQVVPHASNSCVSDSISEVQKPVFKYERESGVFDIGEPLHYSPAELQRFRQLVGMPHDSSRFG